MKDEDYIINDYIWESSVLSLSTSSSTMLSSSVRPVARCRALRTPLLRRNASGTPHYNEPSGWLFGEKVRLNVLNTFWVSSTSISPHHLDKSVKRRAGKLFGIGECLEGWACQRSCYIINRTRGTLGYLQWLCCLTKLRIVYVAFRPGRYKKLKPGWRHEGRRLNINRLHSWMFHPSNHLFLRDII